MFKALNKQRKISTTSQFAKYILVCRLLKTVKSLCFIGFFTSVGYDLLGLSSTEALAIAASSAFVLLSMDAFFHLVFLQKIKVEGEALHTNPFTASINELYKAKAVKATDIGLSKFLNGARNA